MSLPPAAGPAGPPHEQIVGSSPASPTPADVSHRLELVEAGLADLSARVDALTKSVPGVVQAAVESEVRVVSGELRHTVSELGRLLVRDLGKLSQILAQHRDAIVEEIRGPSAAPPAPVPEGPLPSSEATAAEVQTSTAAAPSEDEGESEDANGASESGNDEGGGRSWRRGRRAR